jgi:hypothetical protein
MTEHYHPAHANNIEDHTHYDLPGHGAIDGTTNFLGTFKSPYAALYICNARMIAFHSCLSISGDFLPLNVSDDDMNNLVLVRVVVISSAEDDGDSAAAADNDDDKDKNNDEGTAWQCRSLFEGIEDDNTRRTMLM